MLHGGYFEYWKAGLVVVEVIKFGDSYEAPQEESGIGSASERSAKKKAEGSETLEQTFNRLQAIVSHLEFMDVEIKQDDLNQKFLTSLAPEWLIQKSSGKGEVNTTSIPTVSTHVSPTSTDVAAASISHDTICAYIASQSNDFQIKYEDINQIDKDDIEEMDINQRWSASIHKMGHFAKECRAPRSKDRGRREIYKQGSKEEEQAPKARMAIDGLGWDWSYMANEEENHALVADDEALTEFALMAKSSSSSKNKIKKEKEGLDSKLTGFESPSKDLETLLGSQRSDKNKEGLRYSAIPPLLLKSTLLPRNICLGLDCLNLLMIPLLTIVGLPLV
nr:hypothetical protein [Tanacetum cinerariifolium]